MVLVEQVPAALAAATPVFFQTSGLFQASIVPAIIAPSSPFSRIRPPVFPADELERAGQMAVAEFKQLPDAYAFEYPRLSLWPARAGRTAAGLWQRLKHLLIGYHDVRTIDGARQYFDSSALGPIHLAVGRAVFRNMVRGGGGATPLLEIGAGHRYVAAALKATFGEMISIHESSPRYVYVPDGYDDPIDIEYPTAFIEDAELPRDAFELSYSVFGSYYGRDQVAVLQRVVDSLRVGGEAFLMWKANSTHGYLASLLKRNPAHFQDGGLDMLVQGASFGSYIGRGESAYLVWVRKRQEGVQVKALFDRASRLQTPESLGENRRDFVESGASVRMSLGGPYFTALLYAPHHLKDVVLGMVDEFDIDLDDEKLYYKLTGRRISDADRRSEGSVRRKLARAILDDELIGWLIGGMPLSMLVRDRLDRVYRVVDKDTSVPEYELGEMIAEAEVRNYHR